MTERSEHVIIKFLSVCVLLTVTSYDQMKGKYISYCAGIICEQSVDRFTSAKLCRCSWRAYNGIITLSSNVSFTNDPVLCPNTLVEFECVGENLDIIYWQYNGLILLVYSFSSQNGQLQTDQRRQLEGIEFSLRSFNFSAEHRTANFSIILVAELSAVYPDTEIECVQSQALSQSIGITYSLQSTL